MTRNEQILSEVQKRYLSDYTHIASKINAFVEGANWADEHPKSETVNKQEFIEKIWQWLHDHHYNDETDTYDEGFDPDVVSYHDIVLKIVEELKEFVEYGI